MMNKDAIKRAIAICGGQVRLGQKMGVPQQTISDWLTRGKSLKAEYAIGMDLATDGQVPKEELRPDIFKPPPTDEGRAA